MQMNQMVPGANPYGEVDPERARQMAIQLANAGITGGQIAAGFLTGPVGASLAYGGGEIAKNIIAGQNPMQSFQQGTQAGILDFGTNAALSKIPFAPLLAGGIKKVAGKTDDVIRLFHGTSKEGFEKLSKSIDILTPDQKLKLASTGGGFPGLSTTTKKEVAKNYANALGGDVVEINLKPDAKIYKINTKGASIDEILNANEIEKLQKQGYDVIQDISDLGENEYRLLSNKNILKKKGIINK